MQYQILLVEDNADIRENTCEILKLANYYVSTASNGKVGFEMALQQKPDLILCDIKMPVMDGYHLLAHVRKLSSFNNTRFVFFSASSERKEIEAGLKMGADDYIVKPFTGEELITKLQKLLP